MPILDSIIDQQGKRQRPEPRRTNKLTLCKSDVPGFQDHFGGRLSRLPVLHLEYDGDPCRVAFFLFFLMHVPKYTLYPTRNKLYKYINI